MSKWAPRNQTPTPNNSVCDKDGVTVVFYLLGSTAKNLNYNNKEKIITKYLFCNHLLYIVVITSFFMTSSVYTDLVFFSQNLIYTGGSMTDITR